ncbi:MAG: carboxypeptidase regulatory-like domain-containing protein [Candidatus Eisenbacteria sp.]|nr:carboxypeptidase regulatory-like domain-containing protein [Candidatus Eisenbacteria bacterium]
MLSRGMTWGPMGASAVEIGFLALLVAISLTMLACDESEENTILQPPGGSSELTGTLTFDGGGGPGLPEALIYALAGYSGACATDFSTIHILGTFNDWDTELWTTDPGMTNLGGCTWVDEIELEAGPIEWKFVTDGGWNNDYVTAGTDGLSGSTQLGSGEGNNLQADVLQDAAYHVLLFEDTSPASYLIAAEEDAPVTRSGTATGAFAIANLPAGTYELIIRADGYLDTHVSNVTLDGKQAVDLATINVTSASGALRGVMAFSDSPSPLPTATVRVLPAGGTSAVATDTTDAAGAFEITGLATDTYDIELSASGYENETVTDVEFVNGQDTDIGTITLSLGCSSAYTSMDIPGEFNGWNPTEAMTEIDACLWADTLTVSVSGDSADLRMKFRTNRNWDTPQDLGTCTSESDVLPFVDGIVAGSVCPVAGEGTAITLRFYETGDYEFQLNEALGTFRVTLLEDAVLGTITGTVAYEDDPADPPTATVRVYLSGGISAVATDTTDVTGEFEIGGLATDTYDIEVSVFCYRDQVVAGVEIINGQLANVGTITLSPGSDYTSMDIPGEFNDWNPTGGMTEIAACLWADILTVSVTGDSADLGMQFRTNRNWYSPQDFGICTSESDVLLFVDGVVSGSVCPSTGEGTRITVRFHETGDYEFQLDEASLTFQVILLEHVVPGTVTGTVAYEDDPADPPTAAIKAFHVGTSQVAAEATTNAAGVFIINIAAGVYDLTIEADGYDSGSVADVQVFGDAETDIGTTTLTSAYGALTGTVAYSDSPSLLPTATIRILPSGDTSVVATDTTDATGAFEIIDLATGTYDIEVSAVGYTGAMVTGVAFVNGQDTDIGVVVLLKPTVGSSELFGTLTFDGQEGPNLPAAVIYALAGYNSSCTSGFSTIHILGSFNDWDTGLWTSDPGMINLGGCTWVDEIEIDDGTIEWKFVTDTGWDNDYVTAGTEGLSGSTQIGSGEGNNLQADVLQDGTYHALLFEGTNSASYLIAIEEDAPVAQSSAATGEFLIDNLPAGTYEIIIRADGYLDTHVSNVSLDDEEVRDLGTLDVVATSGALLGTVAFSDSPSPLPTATVRVFPAGGTSAVAIDTSDATGAFEITGLATGTYDIEVSASGYVAEMVPGTEFVNGQDTDIGTITLSLGCSSAYTSMDIPGEFNGWNPTEAMMEIDACLWADTLTVSVSGDSADLRMKFRTNRNWDTPQDLGTCTSESDVLPFVDGIVAGSVCPVAGEGTAITLRFYETGDYEFRLDEASGTFRVTLLEDAVLGTITGTVAYEDHPDDPPTATIKALLNGTSQVAAQTTADTSGAFSITIAAGVYDLTIEADGYEAGSVPDVQVAADEETDVGSITLEVSETCTPSYAIEVLGDFNGWVNTVATLVEGCSWADTVTVATASTQKFKFRTNQWWDVPLDYGSCDSYGGEDFIFQFEGGEVSGATCGESGTGTAISVAFPAAGDYRFELDEQARTFRIVQLEAERPPKE